MNIGDRDLKFIFNRSTKQFGSHYTNEIIQMERDSRNINNVTQINESICGLINRKQATRLDARVIQIQLGATVEATIQEPITPAQRGATVEATIQEPITSTQHSTGCCFLGGNHPTANQGRVVY